MLSKAHLKQMFRTQIELENQMNELSRIEKITTCGHCAPTYENTKHMLKAASNAVNTIIDSYFDTHEEINNDA